MDMAGTDVNGATPTRNPIVTTPAAAKVRKVGVERVCTEETRIVRGRTRPLAIWKVV